ncbi:hypothetical protein PsorP6_008439 [Peronosclerospora sorghi]|uniref:Uncharacterized protein n=1 Tax=Peronosclerospora sorghi TaxID=230839 RepID=A0ACC0W9Z2_9STRA|nr:hypothetical protein PsorP6_008439 [Peronosclerospora sorghi]
MISDDGEVTTAGSAGRQRRRREKNGDRQRERPQGLCGGRLSVGLTSGQQRSQLPKPAKGTVEAAGREDGVEAGFSVTEKRQRRMQEPWSWRSYHGIKPENQQIWVLFSLPPDTSVIEARPEKTYKSDGPSGKLNSDYLFYY